MRDEAFIVRASVGEKLCGRGQGKAVRFIDKESFWQACRGASTTSLLPS
jgi:hypothetical protein